VANIHGGAGPILGKNSQLPFDRDGRWPGAKEGDAFLSEFRQAGFSDATILRVSRNARTKNPLVLAAEVRARR
jgi:hypothetical protein